MSKLVFEMMNTWRFKHTELVMRMSVANVAPALFSEEVHDELISAERNFHFWANQS